MSYQPLPIGSSTAATSVSVTSPSDKSMGFTGRDANGNLLSSTGKVNIATGSSGGIVLAGASNRRIYRIDAWNLHSAAVFIYLTSATPAGSFPNFTNLIAVFQIGLQNAAAPRETIFGYPTGTADTYAVASTSNTSQTDPATAPSILFLYGP